MSTSAPPVLTDPVSDPVSDQMSPLDALAAELPGAYVHVADMADEADRERLVADALDRFGRVDVLVNNAGVGGTVAVEHEAPSERELDGALLLLASSAGTVLTGQSIIVDGGWTAR